MNNVIHLQYLIFLVFLLLPPLHFHINYLSPQVRTKEEPLRWPLPDAVGTNPVPLGPTPAPSTHPLGHHPGLTNASSTTAVAPVLPLHNLPPPPLPRNFRPLPPHTIPPPDLTRVDDDLNPEVPAFVPNVHDDQSSVGKQRIPSESHNDKMEERKGENKLFVANKENNKKHITIEGQF